MKASCSGDQADWTQRVRRIGGGGMQSSRRHVRPGLQRDPKRPGLSSNRPTPPKETPRSEEHTSELQSLMRISYAVFCLKKKNKNNNIHTTHSKRNEHKH